MRRCTRTNFKWKKLLSFEKISEVSYCLFELLLHMGGMLITNTVNLGKWILRHIFSNLIDEMIKRDEAFRKELNDKISKGGQRAGAPTSIQLPPGGWSEIGVSATTPRANGSSYPMTPGMGIGVATPAPLNHLPGVPEDGAPLDKLTTDTSRTYG